MMKAKQAIFLKAYILIVCMPSLSLSAQSDKLAIYIDKDLKRIEETFNILSKHSNDVWPQWSNYNTVPFSLNYPNGLKVLINHPNPPKGFSPLNTNHSRLNVTINRESLDTLNLDKRWYTYSGAAVSTLGDDNSTPVKVVQVYLKEVIDGEDVFDRNSQTAEYQILTLIHELFHVFQDEVKMIPVTHQEITEPNIDFLVYSNIEGIALRKALETNNKKEFLSYVKDFLNARKLKRSEMTLDQQKAESEQEISEGIAQYAMYKILREINPEMSFVISKESDPHFKSFQDKSKFLSAFLNEIKQESNEVFKIFTKKYFYGAAQGFILDRLAPNWKNRFINDSLHLDQLIEKHIKESSNSEKNKPLKDYNVQELREYYLKAFHERDKSFEHFFQQKGKAIIINFREVEPFLNFSTSKLSFPNGISILYPNGVDSLKIANTVIINKKRPLLKSRFSYLTYIKPIKDVLTMKFEDKTKDDILINVHIKSQGFELFTSKAKIIDLDSFIKINILN